MERLPYGIGITTPMTLDEAEAAVRAALAEEGFGVLTEIDVAATMKAKLDLDMKPYKILGACNPPLAARALAADEHIGMLLPCNVVVYESATGTVVAAMEPAIMATISPEAALAEVAADARERLTRALSTLEE